MDAVAEIREHAEIVLKGWLQDGDTILKTAQAAGVDLAGVFSGQRVIRTLSGTLGPAGPGGGGGTTATTATPRRRSTRRRSTTGRRNGQGPSDGQIIGALPANQSQLAAKLGTSRQTIAKRLDTLTAAGLVMPRGAATRKMWHPAGG